MLFRPFFYPTTYSKNRTLEEFIRTMSNVKHTIGCTFTQDASIHWLEVRMSSKKCPHRFFGGTGRSLEPSLWCESSDFGGEVWVLSQKLIPDTSWSIHDICESSTGKYIPAPSKACHLTLREGELTAFSGRSR